MSSTCRPTVEWNLNINQIIYRGSILFVGLQTGFATMDPLFMSYSQVNGVPQESKLATYMQNRRTPTSGMSSTLSSLSLEESTPMLSQQRVTPQAPEFVPNASAMSRVSPNFLGTFTMASGFSRQASGDVSTPRQTPQPSPPLTNCSPIPSKHLAMPLATYQENVGGTTYFYPTPSTSDPSAAPGGAAGAEEATGAAASYHVYPGTPTHLSVAKPQHGKSSAPSYYVADELRAELLGRNALVLALADPEQHPDLPDEIDTYHELCPLSSAPSPSKVKHLLLGYTMSTYKATNLKDGNRYCLRRVHGFRLPNPKCMGIVDMWKRVQHSNIVQLREVFTTKAFGDNSMIFVYDYHPGSETLYAKHFCSGEQLNGYNDPFPSDPSAPRPYSHQKNTLLRHQHTNMLPENVIWNYVIQLTSAVRAIHAAGLACRSLDPTKILLTSPTRLRLSSLCISDIIAFDATAANPLHHIPHFQQDDLTALGKIVLALACKSLLAVQRENILTSIELIGRAYSSDLRNLVRFLLTTQQSASAAGKSVTDLMPMIGARFYLHLDQLQLKTDMLENELAKEMENGRLCRLMAKLGTVNERPELQLDPAWAETGDRYMLKLFRDYLFHQIAEDGRPWVDMAHIVQCLNKLDAGTSEKVSLMSRDEQSVLVVSYGELKHCLEQSFQDILNATSPDGIL